MPSIDAAADAIRAADLPVLALDTCILLDVIRSLHRGQEGCAEHSDRLLQFLTSDPPSCSDVIPSIVIHEWNKHVAGVVEEANRLLAAMETHSSHFHDACRAMGITLGFGRASYTTAGVVERLRDLSAQILDRATRLDGDDRTRMGAFQRVVDGLPPSRKGGQIQDCTITEEVLALCRGLTDCGFDKKRVFCTSNVNDYLEPGKKLHTSLTAEFGAVGLIFTTNLGWALHELTHP